MENRIVNYEAYTIITEEGTERGIFFRKPIQKVDFGVWCDNPYSAWEYKDKIKNPVRRIYEMLLGNKKIIDNIEEWSKQDDWAGFSKNILCFPVYFKREYRKLKAISNNDTDNITEINSYGYESEFNHCSGCCVLEKTNVKLKSSKILRIKRKEHYYYTYEHVIKDVIDCGVITA